MNKCLLDMDGVIVDFWKGACDFFNKPLPNWDDYEVGTDITKSFGMSSTHLWESLSAEFWEYLQPTEDYLEIIGLLELKFGQENICILSSPVINPSCTIGKIRWIEKNIPKYRRQYLLGPKKFFCAASNHLLVDDYSGHCIKFEQHGGDAFLLPRPWNEQRGKNPVELLKDYLNGKSE